MAKGGWRVFDKRYWPGDRAVDHLVFALKHELFDLLCLKRALEILPRRELEGYILANPTGIYARKLGFLHEWLLEKELDVPNSPKCGAIELLDPEEYFTVPGTYSMRHRLRNNLLGDRRFCPIIRRTPLLCEFIRSGLKEQSAAVVGEVSAALVARAAAFLLLADSQASFAIEGESAPANRIERWGKAVAQAGKFSLSIEEIVRLQKILIRDTRFTRIGLRAEGVFLGERDADRRPLPEFIGARPDDLEDLTAALVATDQAMAEVGLDPVLHAAATAFGFVYIHPLEDGNGRLHRYLIHHVLAARGFSPPGLVFPVSSVMLTSIDRYREVLRRHTRPLMDLIEWETTEKMNVAVRNSTRDLYRYFDCTEGCEYLYGCVRETIERTLPEELRHLRCFDRALAGIGDLLDMPDNVARSLVIFIRQNHGTLPKRRRRGEFATLTDQEVAALEKVVRKAFLG